MADAWYLRIAPRWDEVDRVRVGVAAFLMGRAVAADVVDDVAMVARELTENAVKHGAFQGGAGQVDVALRLSATDVTVEVRNPVRRDDRDGLALLDRTVRWIRGFQDPFQAFAQRVSEIGNQALGCAESHLGLVRIACEGRALVDFRVDDHDVLAVSAVHRRRAEGSAL